MKILKPGKAEQRKFVCQACGCVFVAAPADVYWVDQEVECPQSGCKATIDWEFGEPYEEPTPTQTDRERLAELLMYSDLDEDLDECVDRRIRNGVTFREE